MHLPIRLSFSRIPTIGCLDKAEPCNSAARRSPAGTAAALTGDLPVPGTPPCRTSYFGPTCNLGSNVFPHLSH